MRCSQFVELILGNLDGDILEFPPVDIAVLKPLGNIGINNSKPVRSSLREVLLLFAPAG